MKAKLFIAILIVTAAITQAAIDWDIYGGNETIVAGSDYRIVNVYDDDSDHAFLDISGGTISSLSTYDLSVADISDGSIGTIVAKNSSEVNVYGGNIYQALQSSDSAVINLFGLTGDPTLTYLGTGVINIYGYNFDFLASGTGPKDGWLSGNWANGNPFEFYLRNLPEAFPNSQIVLHEIPEPATVLLFGLGSFFLRA